MNVFLIEKSNNVSLMSGEYNPKQNVEEEKIDQHLFLEALILCAYEIPFNYPQPTSIEKVINSNFSLIVCV